MVKEAVTCCMAPPTVRDVRLVGFSPCGPQGKAGKHISQASSVASIPFLPEPEGGVVTEGSCWQGQAFLCSRAGRLTFRELLKGQSQRS